MRKDKTSQFTCAPIVHLHGSASYHPKHQPILCPTTCWPPQQLTSFWIKSLHWVPAGKQPGGGVPATGGDGVVVAVTTAPTTATTTTTIITITHQTNPRWFFKDDLEILFMLTSPQVMEPTEKLAITQPHRWNRLAKKFNCWVWLIFQKFSFHSLYRLSLVRGEDCKSESCTQQYAKESRYSQ